MDKTIDKRSRAAIPNVASAEEIPRSELLTSFSEESRQFLESAPSSDLSDVSSLSSSSSSSFLDEPLNDFSDMLAKLPIKRGLSKFYEGKSRGFISISDEKCVEDLAKREIRQEESSKLITQS